MTGDRRPFQMSLAFMLLLLIVGGPLLGVIVPRLIGGTPDSGPQPAESTRVIGPKDMWPNDGALFELRFVVEGANLGCMWDDGEPRWESDHIEPGEPDLTPTVMQ